MSKCLNTHVSNSIISIPYTIVINFILQICMMSSNSTLALANVGTEKIYSDSSTDKVYVQYTGPTEM